MNIDVVKRLLGDDAELFDFEEKDGVVAAKLKKFYRDRNEFAKIAQRVKNKARGVYVPKDKGGPYFTFKDEEAMSTVTSDQKAVLIKDALEYVNKIAEQVGSIHMQIDIVKEKLKELQK